MPLRFVRGPELLSREKQNLDELHHAGAKWGGPAHGKQNAVAERRAIVDGMQNAVAERRAIVDGKQNAVAERRAIVDEKQKLDEMHHLGAGFGTGAG